MGISHEEASSKSKALCESLFDQLSKHLSDLKKAERKSGTHVFVVPGRPQLTWVYHRKNLEKVEIWPYFDYRKVEDLHEFVRGIGLPLRPRKNYAGIARLYPLPITLQTQEDIGKALQVLLFAHKSQNAGVDKIPYESPLLLLQPEVGGGFSEGTPRSVILTRYERDPGARAACIAHFGVKCHACGFDFESVYGQLGKGFIHVHHVVELSKVRKKYIPDPKKDLLPVCPNCHAMLHRTDPALTITQLKAFLLHN